MTQEGGKNPQHDTLEEVRKCFSGLCLYAAQEAVERRYPLDLREFAMDMVSFWGLDEDEKTDGSFEAEFDHAVSEAIKSRRSPEITEQTKSELLSGLQLYLEEQDISGGKSEFYTQCRSILDTMRTQWGVDTPQQLEARLTECPLARARAVGATPDIAGVYELGRYAAMHEYLTTNHSFETGEVSRLLRFRDPLEAMVESSGSGNSIQSMDIGSCLDSANAEENFPLVYDSAGCRVEQAEKQKTPSGKTPVRTGRKDRGR